MVKSVLSGIGLTIISLSVIAIILEVVLAGILPAPIEWKNPQESYVNDPVTGYRLSPQQTAYTHAFPLKTNRHGFRGREVSMRPPSGTIRILCLGDSLTFGAGVADQDTYPSQLEVLLNGRSQSKYEVINTGVPGYDTWQESAFLHEYGIKFHPDIVILGFYANDVVPKPKVVPGPVNHTGALKRQGVGQFVPDPVIHLLKRSRLLLLLRDRYKRLMNQVVPAPEFEHQRALLDGGSSDFNEMGWAEVERAFKDISDLRRAENFHLLVVIFPMAEQLVHRHPTAQYQSRVKVLAEKFNIPVIDLKPAFEEKFNGFGSLFIEWDGHPNGTAFAIAAKKIQGVIETMMEKPGN